MSRFDCIKNAAMRQRDGVTVLKGKDHKTMARFLAGEIEAMMARGKYDEKFLYYIGELERTWMKLYPDEEMWVLDDHYDEKGYVWSIHLYDGMFDVETL